MDVLAVLEQTISECQNNTLLVGEGEIKSFRKDTMENNQAAKLLDQVAINN